MKLLIVCILIGLACYGTGRWMEREGDRQMITAFGADPDYDPTKPAVEVGEEDTLPGNPLVVDPDNSDRLVPRDPAKRDDLRQGGQLRDAGIWVCRLAVGLPLLLLFLCTRRPEQVKAR